MASARAGRPDGPDEPADASGPASLVRAVKRRPLVVALVALAAVGVAALWLAARSDSYEATAEVLVTPAPDDGGPTQSLPLLRTSGDRTRIVQTAVSLLDSAGAARGAAQALGGGWTPERVAGAVTVEPVGQTDVIAVTAQADSPALAARVANAFAQAALDARAEALRPRIEVLRNQLQADLQGQSDPKSQVAVDVQESLSELRAVEAAGDPTLSLTRRAEPPTSSVGSSPWLLLALALVAGLVVGIGAALVADLIGPPAIADAAQVAALAGAPVVATVPALAAGHPPPPAVIRAARYVELHVGGDGPSLPMLLFAGPTEGDESAACVAGFGIALADAGRHVLLADLDPAGAVAPWIADAQPGDASLRLHGRRAVPTRKERQRYDCVLVHAPSIIESGDALRAAGTGDAAVFVVLPRRTSVEDIELALRLLERAGSRPDGIILVNGPGLRDRFVRALQRVSAPVDIGDRPRELELRRAR
jgi:capsular polysaccharide biosynthesis protein